MDPRSWLLAGVALSVSPALAAAQPRPTDVLPPNRPDQAQPAVRPPPTTPLAAAPRPAAAPQAFAPFELKGVAVEGSTLPRGELEAAWRPFVGQRIDPAGLVRLTDALAAVYARHDIAIYTLVAPRQDLSSGVVHVRALEGQVEAVEITGVSDARERSLVERYLAKLTSERPLRRSTLQRSISLIRDLPGLDTQMELENGKAADGVRLKLALHPHPVQTAFSINNRGTAFLGRTQMEGSLIFNSLLRPGDQTRLNIAAPTDLKRFQSYSIQQSEPLGADGLTATLGASYLRTRPRGTDILGHASSVGVQLSYPWLRGYERNLYLTVGLDGVNNDNAFLGFTFANDRTRAARVALAYNVQTGRRLAYASATLSQGIDGLGARTTDPQIGRPDFRKLNARAGANFVLGQHAALRLAAAGQAASDRLPATELFALGGEDFGRAYEAAAVAGDDGVAASAEFAYAPERMPVDLRGSEGFVFIDGGKVWYRSRFGLPSADARLASAGVGVRAKVANRALLQLEIDRALETASPFQSDRGWRGIFTLRTLF